MLAKPVVILTSRTTLFGLWSIFLLVFCLFFSNVISRVMGINVNGLLYLAVTMSLVFNVKHLKLTQLNVINLLLVIVFLFYVLDPRSNLEANIYSIKDFVVPLLCFFIGGGMILYRAKFINIVNYLFAPFVLYGVFQQYAFYSGNLDALLPWDSRQIVELQEAGVSNLYQGMLLRFFGTMNAFAEYQILVVMLVLFLYLEKRDVRNGFIFKLNVAASIVFIIFSLERSPIFMLMIIVFIWKFDCFFKYKRIIFNMSAALLVAFLVSFSSMYLSNMSPTTGDAYRRITNILALDFKSDSSASSRLNTEWKKGLELASDNYMGIGPGRVTPAAQDFDGAVQPHNNYLVYFLGYGLFGFGLFIYFIGAISYGFLKRRDEVGMFGLGITASFLAMAMFNVPFAGKAGMLYFLQCGLLLRMPKQKKEYRVMSRNLYVSG